MSNKVIDKDMLSNLRKEIIEELRLLKRSEDKQLKILQSLFLEEKKDIRKEYDNMVCDEFDIKVFDENNHTQIKLPQISHRTEKFVSRLLYEDTLRRVLHDYRENENINAINTAMIIFEHFASEGRLWDNDNYNSAETKQIVDALTHSGLLVSDRGIDCQILHISTISDSEVCTIIHIINLDDEKAFEEINYVLKSSVNINKEMITNSSNDTL